MGPTVFLARCFGQASRIYECYVLAAGKGPVFLSPSFVGDSSGASAASVEPGENI